jgi:hypothetical protein
MHQFVAAFADIPGSSSSRGSKPRLQQCLLLLLVPLPQQQAAPGPRDGPSQTCNAAGEAGLLSSGGPLPAALSLQELPTAVVAAPAAAAQLWQSIQHVQALPELNSSITCQPHCWRPVACSRHT